MKFFVQQCSILQNGRVLSHIDYKTNLRKFNVSINEAKTLLVLFRNYVLTKHMDVLTFQSVC